MPRVLRLLKNNVWLKPLQSPLISRGGILLSEHHHRDIRQFLVIDVAPNVKAKGEIKRGMRVIAPLIHDWHMLPDGSKITDANQVQLVGQDDGNVEDQRMLFG
jgi:hypothetical protein